MAMKLVKKTDAYSIYQRSDKRYAVKDGSKNPINGVEKTRILVEEELIVASIPSEAPEEAVEESAEAAPEAEASAEEAAEEEAPVEDAVEDETPQAEEAPPEETSDSDDEDK
ncbi:MAG: hypothetical protein AAGA91_00045 [Pseudomonadota bacterium]